MSTYVALFRIRFTNSLQYRTAALAGLITQFAWGFMQILAFLAFYRSNSQAFPMEFSDTVSYIWLQQAFLALFMMWFYEREIFDTIESGTISYELVRPYELYNRWFCQSLANRLARAVLRCLPILIVALLVPEPIRLRLPASLGQFGLFIVSMFLGLGVVVAFSMLVYIASFFTLSSTGNRIIAAVLSDFLAGALIPLPFFPIGFRKLAQLLPFAAMQNMPLRIYSGNISGREAFYGILFQASWLIILIVVGKLWQRQALKQVVVQGG